VGRTELRGARQGRILCAAECGHLTATGAREKSRRHERWAIWHSCLHGMPSGKRCCMQEIRAGVDSVTLNYLPKNVAPEMTMSACRWACVTSQARIGWEQLATDAGDLLVTL